MLLISEVKFWQNEVELIHDIEKEIGKKLEEFECKENEVLENITQVRSHYTLLLNCQVIQSANTRYTGFQR